MIKLENIKKAYNDKLVLNGVTLDINKGEIIGLLGPNGEGKSTLIKILTGLITDYDGEYYFEGESFCYIHKNYIGYMSDKGIIPDNWLVKEAIDFYDTNFTTFNKEKAYNMVNSFMIDNNSKISDLSKGNSEKLHLSLALSINAKLYLLDEPLASIDLINREEIIESILDNFDGESTIIIISHLIKDIERILDRVIFLRDGKVERSELVEDLRLNGKSVISTYKEVYMGEYI